MTTTRELLLAERARAQERAAALDRELAGISEAASQPGTDDEHDPEGATLAFERQHTAALLARALEQISEIDAAIGRIDSGTYGICLRCGQPVGEDRLAARPAAATCLRCARLPTPGDRVVALLGTDHSASARATVLGGGVLGEYALFTLVVTIAGVMIIGRAVANRFEVPQAVVMVVLGALASLIPQFPRVNLPPALVLLLFLPPLVYHAAFFSAPRETRENAVPITALAFGTTTATIAGVGWVTRLLLPGLGWAGALAFAAAVAPTDAVAATSVLTRLGAPQRIVTIMEGESLINDGVALTAFGLAVNAMTSPFTLGHGAERLIQVVAGGTAYGLVVAVVIEHVRRRVHDPSIQLTISLVTPFVAYIPAQQLDVSGVLATVVTGVYLGTKTEGVLQAASRASGAVFWQTLVFLLESSLFVLLGLELRTVVRQLPGAYSAAWLTRAAIAEIAVVVGIRMAWELIVSPLIRLLPGRHSTYVGSAWRQRVLVGWGGMRGAISLAIALTLPLTAGGRPFTARPTLVFLAACVVLTTLVGEGLTLAPLVRVLGLGESEARRRAEASARAKITEAGLARLDEMASAGEVDEDTAGMYRQLFELRLDRVRAALGDTSDGDAARAGTGIRLELVRAQRDKLAQLYSAGKISDDIRRSISGTLDLEERRRGFG